MIGTAGQWEVFLGTEMPEQQKYELSNCVSERWILQQVLCLGWRTTHVCVCNSLISWVESGIWGAAGCCIQHHTRLNESVSSNLGKYLLWLMLRGEALKSQVLSAQGGNGKH